MDVCGGPHGACLAVSGRRMIRLQAHETIRSSVNLTPRGNRHQSHIAFRDIEGVVWLDENLDGAGSWAEAVARLPAVSTCALQVLHPTAGGDCVVTQNGAGVSDSGGVADLDPDFRGTCPSTKAPLRAASGLFSDVDPDHRAYLGPRGHADRRICRPAAPANGTDHGSGGRLDHDSRSRQHPSLSCRSAAARR